MLISKALVSFNQTLGCLRKTPTSVGVLQRQPSVWLNETSKAWTGVCNHVFFLTCNNVVILNSEKSNATINTFKMAMFETANLI